MSFVLEVSYFEQENKRSGGGVTYSKVDVMILCRLYPVSYTHLDVYKRQWEPLLY